MNVYTDPRLLDVAGAVAALPCLPLSTAMKLEEGQSEANNLEDQSLVAPTTVNSGNFQSLPGKNCGLTTEGKNEKTLPKQRVWQGF
ncbi:MAG: hypothetical protein KF851_01505 [Pirellulaceae bacterium]|nr:hypothetical protein [Pirellulaceae bacterium]